MAVTKIWPVKGSLSKLLNYAANEDKTALLPDTTGLQNLIDYAANESKTTHDTQYYVSGQYCSTWITAQEMTTTKKRFGKEGGITAFHAYQSFRPGEVTPEQCHRIGVELAARAWPDHEVLIATHLNTDCCHNHFVINSVGLNGKRLGSRWSDYQRLRDASDALCREHGLTVVQRQPNGKTPRNIYLAEQRGDPTKHNVMREDIDDAIGQSRSFEQMAAALRSMGYTVRYGPERKYATLAMPGSSRPVRFATLGEQYTEEAIRDRLFEPHSYHPHRGRLSYAEQQQRQAFYRLMCRQSGFLRTYMYYCYLLGFTPKRTGYRPLHPALRADLQRFETIKAQMELIERYDLQDMAAVEAFLDSGRTRLDELTAQRDACYRLLKHPKGRDVEEVRRQRNELSEQIAVLRRELRHAQGIEENVKRMEENIRMVEQQERAQRSAQDAHRKGDEVR